jgi:hypothetical protein
MRQSSTGDGINLALDAGANTFDAYSIIGGGSTFEVNSPQILNQWVHLAVERVSGSVTLYVNGTSAGSYNNTLDLSPYNLTIGNLEYATARYRGNFSVPTTAFENDYNTLLLAHFDTDFSDDNVINAAPPAPIGGIQVSTLDSSNVSYTFNDYGDIEYAGTDSNAKPVFLTMWHEGANSTAATLKYQAFTANTDGSINKGPITQYGGSGYAFPRFAMENDFKGASGFSGATNATNYGVLGHYDYNITDWFLVGFQLDLDTLTISFGNSIDITNDNGVSSSVWDAVYVGNGQYAMNYRGGNNSSYMMSNLVTRTSGTNITLTQADKNLGTTGGMGVLEMLAFPNNTYVTTFSLNNGDGIGIGINKVDGGNQIQAGGVGASQVYQELGDGGEYNSGSPEVTRLNDSGRFAIAGHNTAGGVVGMFMRVGEITDNGGLTAPSATFTNYQMLDTNFYACYGIAPISNGSNSGKVYTRINDNLHYKTFQYDDGTSTITVDPIWNDTGVFIQNTGTPTYTYYNDGIRTYTLLTFRNVANNQVDVVVDVT